MAAPLVDDPTVPVGCTDAALPTGLAAVTCYEPTLNFGPITNLYFASAQFPDGATPVPTAVEIAAFLAPTVANATATPPVAAAPAKMVGPIVVEISYSPPSDEVIRSNGKDFPRPTTLVAAVTLQNTSDANVEFARSTQKGGRDGFFFGTDKNGNWYGGRNGVFNGRSTLVLRNNIPTGEDDLHTITGTIKRRGFFDAKRGTSPVPTI